VSPLRRARPAGGGPALKRRPFLLATLLVVWLPAGASASARELRLLMGTTAEVSVAGTRDDGAALEKAFAALQRVDDQMSLWKESELTRLNRQGQAAASRELREVVALALELAAASGGAFDPTVEPLLRAAGDYGGTPRRLGESERQRLLAQVGFRHVRLEGERIRLEPGTALDLGGIAKGYAVDLALGALREAGAQGALVDLGGSSIAGLGQPLRLELRDPDGGAPLASFVVDDGAVSTSGGDQRPGHILDPRSGRTAQGVVETTVVAGTAMEADGLSTAVFVLGAEQGLALLLERRAEGAIVTRAGRALLLRTTPGFAARHALVTRADVRFVP
jgi:thiamine biosynthesis lipoprotein